MERTGFHTVDTDEKVDRIIAAASDAFLAYGFRRVSMADIAEGAGMSRAALYLHFRNKEDIFASVAARYYAKVARDMKAALTGSARADAALKAAFRAKIAPPFRRMLESPHGRELLDARAAVSPQEIAAGDAALVAVLADWLAAGMRAGRLAAAPLGMPASSNSARDTARVILAAVHGVVAAAVDFETLSRDLDRLAALFGRALSA